MQEEQQNQTTILPSQAETPKFQITPDENEQLAQHSAAEVDIDEDEPAGD